MSALRRERFESANRQSSIAPQSAFTMVEIALCLAVIGFALVAIIGVLPRGLEVQRENREETIINQDAQVWFSALRAGSRGYDDLTNYVDAITNNWARLGPNGNLLAQGRDAYWNDPNPSMAGSDIRSIDPPPFLPPTNGHRIIGLLSTPRFTYHNVANQIIAQSNYVTAYVRAMSGAATEKFPQTNQSVRDLSFSYRMVSEIVPFTGWDTNWVGFGAANLTSEEVVSRSNHWKVAANTHANLHNIRLLFRWPLLPSGEAGKGRQVFRATTSGVMSNNPPYHFLNPRTYVRYQ
jgi:type II secretory pathway pseudopilin PulG